MDVVESGHKNIELCLVTEQECKFLTEEEIDKLVQ